MKTINTSQTLKNFKGENLKNEGEDLTIGFVLSNILGGRVSNPTLGWVFGKKFATEEAVDLKAEDIVFLKKEIESNDTWLAIVKGQLIELLDSSEENIKKDGK